MLLVYNENRNSSGASSKNLLEQSRPRNMIHIPLSYISVLYANYFGLASPQFYYSNKKVTTVTCCLYSWCWFL